MSMNDQQRDSMAKYMYDLSKGIALLTVIKPLWEPGVLIMRIARDYKCSCSVSIWHYVYPVASLVFGIVHGLVCFTQKVLN